MRNISCLFSCIFLLASGLRSQDRTYIQQSSLGVQVFANKFIPADGVSSPAKAGLAMNYLQGFTPRTDINVTLAGSFLSAPFDQQSDGSKHLFLEADASVREKLFPGRRSINPFIQVGLGISRLSVYYGAFLPAGVGLQANLPGETFLLLHAQYRIPLTNMQSGHFYGSLGIAGIIGRKKKRNMTSVTLPHRSGTPSPSSQDTDGDGIVDSLDACPSQPGLQTFGGCPDTDGDGIPDKEDKCPLVRGVRRLHGCPEPDKDKDGVIDEEDKCPDVPGFRETAGCPPLQKDILRKINLAAKKIFFETDKYILLPASYKALDEVAAILRDNPYLKMEIGGHTDSTGGLEKNQVLSEHRAHAVLEYLSERSGIAKERLSSTGYGSSRPLTSNGTPEGRALNRRVELVLKYY